MINFVGTAQKGKESLLYYCETKSGSDFFNVVTSYDGFEFMDTSKYVVAMDTQYREEDSYNWKSFRISKQGTTYFLTYKITSATNSLLFGALSETMILWKKTG